MMDWTYPHRLLTRTSGKGSSHLTLLCVLFIGVVGSPHPSRANVLPTPQSATEGAYADVRFEGVSEDEGRNIIKLLRDAQKNVIKGKDLHFTLMGGAVSVSFEVINLSPFQMFTSMPLDKIVEISYNDLADDPLPVFTITIAPDGKGPRKSVWEVKLTRGHTGQIEKITMLYRPVHPF